MFSSPLENYAITEFQTRGLSPQMVDIMGRLIEAYKKRQVKQVVKYCDQAIALDVTPAEVYLYLAWARLQKRNNSLALMCSEEALQVNPDLALAYYQQGLIYFRMDDYEKSLASFNEAMSHDYQPLEAAYYERSKCYEALGQIAEAKADLGHILTLSVDNEILTKIAAEIALLERAEIKPLSPPDKVPDGLTIEESESSLVISVDRNIKLTLDTQCLKMTQPPGFFSDVAPIEVPRSAIGQIICQREVSKKQAQIDSYILLTDNQTQFLTLTNYEQVRYIQWKLREQLNLPDLYQPDEYLFAEKATGADVTPIGEWGVYEFGCVTLIVILFGGVAISSFVGGVNTYFHPFPYNPRVTDPLVYICFGLASLLVGIGLLVGFLSPRWYVQEMQDKGRVTPSVVSYKNYYKWRGKATHHHYKVYYRYYGYEAIVDSKEMFDLVEVGTPIKVKYLPTEPHLSNPHYKTGDSHP